MIPPSNDMERGRGGDAIASLSPATLFASLSTDPLWATEYRDYVRQVTFADPSELIGFDQVLALLKDLVEMLEAGKQT
jgi:hypothetical protein